MYLIRRSELLCKRLFVLFFLCCWSALPRDSCFDHGFLACPLSRPVLNTCFRNVEPCPLFFCFLCILRYPSLCAVLSSLHKTRSVVKLRWCPQNWFKSCHFVNPSGKVLRCSHHSLSSSLLLCSVSWYIAPSPLGKLCREQVCVRAL